VRSDAGKSVDDVGKLKNYIDEQLSSSKKDHKYIARNRVASPKEGESGRNSQNSKLSNGNNNKNEKSLAKSIADATKNPYGAYSSIYEKDQGAAEGNSNVNKKASFGMVRNEDLITDVGTSKSPVVNAPGTSKSPVVSGAHTELNDATYGRPKTSRSWSRPDVRDVGPGDGVLAHAGGKIVEPVEKISTMNVTAGGIEGKGNHPVTASSEKENRWRAEDDIYRQSKTPESAAGDRLVESGMKRVTFGTADTINLHSEHEDGASTGNNSGRSSARLNEVVKSTVKSPVFDDDF